MPSSDARSPAANATDGGAKARPPVGKTRSPLFVAVLGVLTFGIYPLYWIWSTAKSTARFEPRAKSPLDPAKWGVPLGAASLVVGVATFATMILSLVMALSSGGVPRQSGIEELQREMLLFQGVMIVGMLIGVLAAIGLFLTLWRVWNIVQRHERGIGRRETLTPGLMLGLLLGLSAAYFVPLANLLAILAGPFVVGFVLYRTQSGLNAIWEAARGGYDPRSAWRPPGQAPATGVATAQGGGTGASSEEPSDEGGVTFSSPGRD